MARPIIEIVQDNEVVVARLAGELDFTDADRVSTELIAATPNDAIGLVLDLSEVRYIDSSGVRMLFDLAGRLDVCRQRLAVALPEESTIRRLIKITKLEEVVLLRASQAECIGGLREAAGPV
ncbi:MAG: STAS domain-containing protein [Actinomycetota bacterium]